LGNRRSARASSSSGRVERRNRPSSSSRHDTDTPTSSLLCTRPGETAPRLALCFSPFFPRRRRLSRTAGASLNSCEGGEGGARARAGRDSHRVCPNPPPLLSLPLQQLEALRGSQKRSPSDKEGFATRNPRRSHIPVVGRPRVRQLRQASPRRRRQVSAALLCPSLRTCPATPLLGHVARMALSSSQ
jgi:hypothetical protein